MTFTRQMKPLAAATALLALLFAAPATAQDPPVNDEGLTPWDYAKDNKALHGLPEVRRLRQAEQEGNPCDDWNSFAFFFSATPDDVRECLDAGADPNARNPDGATPLHLAAHRSESPEIVAILVEAGADPNARGPFGLTPLHMTWSERGSLHAGVFRELLRLGADPLARDDRGRIADPTHCEHWNTRAFSRLAARPDFARCLEQGADVLARDDNRYFANDGGYTVLHHATANEDGSVIALLVAAGAELEARNDYGFTPLHRAISNDRLTAVTALLDAGADIEADARGIWGTPLISATVGISGTRFNRNATTMAIIDALLAAGADVNAVDEDGDTPLLNVLRKGRSGLASGMERLRGTEATADSVVDLAMKLLEVGADPAAQGARGQTPLHVAAEYSTPVLVQALLDAGADPRVRNEWGTSPLHSAARTGTPEIIALLVAAGAEVNGRDEYGRSPLHVAVASVPYTFEGGDPQPEAGPWLLRTGALMEAGADPNLPDAAGNTPLHLAAEELDTSLLSLLASAGADVNARNDSGETPLVTARNHANVPTLRHLLDLGADPGVLEETGGIDGPLCDLSGSRFVSRAPPESLRDCLEAGVSVNAPGDFGRTPLLQLAGSGYLSYDAPDYDGPDKVTLLLDAGANPNARLSSGRTALHLVAEADTDYDGRRMWDSDAGRAAATALIQAGADVEARDTLGETPLHKAARWVSRDTISLESLLLDAGADVNARANDGQTPLHLAASHDHPLVVSALIEAGAEVDARTNEGLTPLHMALRWGRPAVAATLLSSGADPDALDGAGNPVDPTDCARWGLPSFFAFATAADIEGCLAAGADPHAGRPQGEPRDNRPNIITIPPPPPLHLAAAGARDPAVITAFLQAGADVDARDRSDRTPLHAAARSGTAAVVRALLDAGAEVDARARRFDPFSGVTNTPLHEAAGNPDPEVAAALLDAGADVNGRGSGGATPLYRAARNENPAVAALLLGAGAEVNAATSDGLTPLHTAAAGNSSPAVIALLLEAGADVDARGAYNHSHAPFGRVTPLHTAAYWNRNPEIVTMLVAAGADPDGGDAPADTAAGQVAAIVANSPLYLAVSNNPNPAVIEALVRAGADLERAGASGSTVLHRAAVYVPRAFPLLLRLGADPEALDAEGKTPMDLARENPALRPWERVRMASPGGARGPQNAAPPTAASAAPATPAQPSCAAWGTPDFFASASAELVRECIQAGVNPEAPVQYVPVIFNAARTSTDPAVIGVLTDAGADPSFRFGEWQLGLGTARRGYTPLHTAAAQNPNPGIVGTLLAVGAELEARDAFGATPLRVAWANPNPAVFRTLLRLGADPLARDDGGRPADPTSCLNWTTPDFWRLARPDEAEVCLALDEDLEARDRNGNTPLHLAVRVANAVAVAILLDADADLGARNNSGATPLHVAAVHEDAEVLDLLLKAGADIDAGAGGRGTPLLDALQNRRGFRTGPTGEVAVDALLRAGADLNAADSAGNVPLLASMDPERPEGLLADLPLRLLALGANPNWRDGRGRTPLHAAAAVGREDVIRALVDAGADPQAMTDDGATTLHAAAASGSPEAIALLSGMGMDTNFRNDDGLAPLHLAVQRTNALLFEVMQAVGEQAPPAWIRRARALLDAGADPNARTPEGDTPLHLSMWHQDSTLVAAFVQAGADLDARNDRGETALHVARARDNRPAVRTLLNLGADPGPV